MAINPIPALSPVFLNGLNPLQGSAQKETPAIAEAGNGAAKAGSDFSKFLSEALQQVENLQRTADVASVGLATGQIQDLHTAMIAMEKANLSLSLTVEVRNRVIDAYQEIARMQI
jgi:flagellar hook-basal body complex protein FliE